MEYFVISAKFVPLKYYTLSSQLQHLTSFSVGCLGWRILSPGQIAVMQKWSIDQYQNLFQGRCRSMSWNKFNFNSVSRSWHMILLVIWIRSALPFYCWAVMLSLNGNAAAHRSVLKKRLAFLYESSLNPSHLPQSKLW